MALIGRKLNKRQYSLYLLISKWKIDKEVKETRNKTLKLRFKVIRK